MEALGVRGGIAPTRPVVQPVVTHYTAWANPAPTVIIIMQIMNLIFTFVNKYFLHIFFNQFQVYYWLRYKSYSWREWYCYSFPNECYSKQEVLKRTNPPSFLTSFGKLSRKETYDIAQNSTQSVKFRFVFWDVLPCKIIVDRRFRGTCCLHHQGDEWRDSNRRIQTT
jgi:hypothetical protein